MKQRLSTPYTAIAALAGMATTPCIGLAQVNEKLEEVIVHGTQDSGLSSVGRNALSADEQARSIQIFRADLIDRINPKGLDDLLPLSSGVVYSGSGDGRETSFAMRGFDTTPILRDGFRIEMFGAPESEVWNFERVEALKGPDSIIYGEANPGGIINLVTKRPQQEDSTVLGMELGSNPSFSPRFDINRAYDNVAVRLVGLYEEDDGWRDFDDSNEKWSFAPSIRWQITEDTVLTYIGEYVNDDAQADFGTIISSNGSLTSAPDEQVTSDPGDRIERHFYMSGLDLQHAINSDFTVELRARQFETEYEYSELWLPVSFDETTQLLRRAPAVQSQSTDETALQFNLFGDVSVANIRNRFTFGIDWRDTDQQGGTLYDPSGAQDNYLNWLDPDYSVNPPAREDIPAFPGWETVGERIGIFFQDNIDLTDSLLFSFGIRYDDNDMTESAYYSTVYQGGVRYTINPSLQIYASYSESFIPQSAYDATGNLLEPETGEGYEVGIKGKLLDESLTYTAAYFDIDKTNVAITDPNFPLASINAGKQNSKGVEADLSGQITDQMSLIFSVAYMDTEDEYGAPLPNAAEMTSSAFITYQITDDWDASIGYEHVGKRETAGYEIDTHTILNAAVGYGAGPWRAQLNLTNLTDERYLDALSYGNIARGNYAGAPFAGKLTVSYSYQ